jgi:hypothetical protein
LTGAGAGWGGGGAATETGGGAGASVSSSLTAVGVGVVVTGAGSVSGKILAVAGGTSGVAVIRPISTPSPTPAIRMPQATDTTTRHCCAVNVRSLPYPISPSRPPGAALCAPM